jgi:hypothetical protein
VEYITAGEFALLLGMFWLPVFFVAAFPQWHLLSARRNRLTWLLAAILFEFALALIVWLSPLPNHFLSLDFLGGFSIGSIPLQAAVVSALAVTLLAWVVGRRVPQPAP